MADGENLTAGEVNDVQEPQDLNEESENTDQKPPGEEGERDKPEARIIELQDQVERLEAEKEGYINRLQRLQADFANYKKRVAKEKSNLNIKVKIELIAELLPVIDNFERALATAETSDFKQGVDMIYRQIMDMLKNEGVEVIPTTGEPFDHNLHEAIMQVEDSEYESGIIVEELQKGYILDGKAIRPAMVKVAQ